MTDWQVGQKIVCINATIDPKLQGSGWSGSKFIQEYLKVGKVYTIEKIAYVMFDSLGYESVAFLLEGCDTNYTKNNMPMVDKYGESFYHFWNGRFKPLEENKTDEKISIDVFLGLLNDVNDGKVKFDEEPKHMKPKRQVEFT